MPDIAASTSAKHQSRIRCGFAKNGSPARDGAAKPGISGAAPLRPGYRGIAYGTLRSDFPAIEALRGVQIRPGAVRSERMEAAWLAKIPYAIALDRDTRACWPQPERVTSIDCRATGKMSLRCRAASPPQPGGRVPPAGGRAVPPTRSRKRCRSPGSRPQPGGDHHAGPGRRQAAYRCEGRVGGDPAHGTTLVREQSRPSVSTALLGFCAGHWPATMPPSGKPISGCSWTLS
jgi:hypothetical protein